MSSIVRISNKKNLNNIKLTNSLILPIVGSLLTWNVYYDYLYLKVFYTSNFSVPFYDMWDGFGKCLKAFLGRKRGSQKTNQGSKKKCFQWKQKIPKKLPRCLGTRKPSISIANCLGTWITAHAWRANPSQCNSTYWQNQPSYEK